jgi:Zinc knuckle
LSLLDARIAYFSCKQTQHQSDAEYLEVFRANVEVLEYYKANISESHLLIDNTDGTLSEAECKKLARGCTIAMAFLRGADQRRYGTLLSDLANQKTRGNDQYPNDLTAAYSMLVNYHAPTQNRPYQGNQSVHPTAPTSSVTIPPTDAHTFAQTARTTTTTTNSKAGSDGVLHSGITCFNCNSTGHYATQCPGALSLVQHCYMLTQLTTHDNEERYEGIPRNWVLLDSQSTISIFNNAKMVTNIRLSPQAVCARTNGGQQTSTHIADFRNLGVVWYNDQSIANILSLSEVRKVCRVTMDTSVEAAMIIHRKDGSTMKFMEHLDGLYYYETDVNPPPTPVGIPAHTFVNTVSNNKSIFVTREIDAADKARELYRKLGRPSQRQFEEILSKNLITNCPVTVDDAKRAMLIYGPDLATIKGKTTRGKFAPHAPDFRAIPIPAPILEHHQAVTLCIDFFLYKGKFFYMSVKTDKTQDKSMMRID